MSFQVIPYETHVGFQIWKTLMYLILTGHNDQIDFTVMLKIKNHISALYSLQMSKSIY